MSECLLSALLALIFGMVLGAFVADLTRNLHWRR